MEYRSSNGGNHQTNDIVAAVGSSHGVQLSGGSTGGLVESVGDDANIALRVRGKGTGAVLVGNSSQAVILGGNVIGIGSASTTFLTLVQRYTVQFTPPALAASTSVSSTFTVVGLTTNAALVFTPRTNLSMAYNVIPRCSTADELTLTFQNITGSTIGTGESTNRGVLLQFG
jgi:hypothetical protein